MAAKEIGYKLVKLPRCPGHSIWRGTLKLLASPIFTAAMRYGDLQPFPGGVLKQPVNMAHFIQFARHEKEAFMMLVSYRRGAEKK